MQLGHTVFSYQYHTVSPSLYRNSIVLPGTHPQPHLEFIKEQLDGYLLPGMSVEPEQFYFALANRNAPIVYSVDQYLTKFTKSLYQQISRWGRPMCSAFYFLSSTQRRCVITVILISTQHTVYVILYHFPCRFYEVQTCNSYSNAGYSQFYYIFMKFSANGGGGLGGKSHIFFLYALSQPIVSLCLGAPAIT